MCYFLNYFLFFSGCTQFVFKVEMKDLANQTQHVGTQEMDLC